MGQILEGADAIKCYSKGIELLIKERDKLNPSEVIYYSVLMIFTGRISNIKQSINECILFLRRYLYDRLLVYLILPQN